MEGDYCPFLASDKKQVPPKCTSKCTPTISKKVYSLNWNMLSPSPESAHHIPLGSGEIPPQPKSGGKESPRLEVQERPTKPRDTDLLLRELAWGGESKVQLRRVFSVAKIVQNINKIVFRCFNIFWIKTLNRKYIFDKEEIKS